MTNKTYGPDKLTIDQMHSNRQATKAVGHRVYSTRILLTPEEKIERRKAYYQANRERILNYQQANRERIREQKKRYWQENKEALSQKRRACRQAKKEHPLCHVIFPV